MRLTSLLILIIMIFLSNDITGQEFEPELIIDDENWYADINLDTWNGVDHPIFINSASIHELRKLPGLSDEDIELIIGIRRRKNIKDPGCLRAGGLADHKVALISPYISFYTQPPISIYQVQRHYYRFMESNIASRYYHKTELQREKTILGFVSLNDYGSRELLRYNSYYISHQTDTVIKHLVLGRYRLSLGQGIAYASKSGFSKSSAATTHPVKNYTPLRPHTNPYKMWSLEGIALHIDPGSFDLIPFYSATKIDASLSGNKISTFYPYGSAGTDRRNNVEERVDGIAVRYRNGRSSYGFYYSHNRFNRKFADDALPDNYKCLGTFFYHRAGEFDLFGEYASIADRPGIIAGIRFGRSKFQQVLLYRSYDKNLPHWHGNPFSSQTNFDNEEGFYYGLRIRFSPRWLINAYFDIWRYPEIRYFEKMPTSRAEQYLQIIHNRSVDTFRLKLHYKNYERYRVIEDIPAIRDEGRTVISFDWTHKLSEQFIQRSGIEYITRYIPEAKDFKKGILLFENLSWHYRQIKLMYQLNIFRSEIGHYIYEYSLDGMWESRPLTGDDLYSYLIIKAEITPDIRLQSKFAYFFSGRTKSLVTQVICRL